MMKTNILFATLSFALLSGHSAVAQGTPAPSPAAAPHAVRVNGFRGDPDPGQEMGGPGFGPHRMPNFGPGGTWWKNPELVQKLGLTAEQQKKMDDIFQQSRLQLIDLKANVEKQELLLEPMLDANPPDANKVLAQIDQVASARAALEKALARTLLGIRGVLSADQWTKLQADRPKFSPRFGPGAPGGPDGAPRSNGFRGGGPGMSLNHMPSTSDAETELASAI